MEALQRRLKRTQLELRSRAAENLLSLKSSTVSKVHCDFKKRQGIMEDAVAESDATVVIAFKRRATSQLQTWLCEKIQQEAPELVVKPLRFIHRQRDTLLVSISEEGMWLGAEERMLRKRVKSEFGGGRRQFTIQDRHRFLDAESVKGFFTTSEQQSMIEYFLTNIRLSNAEVCDGISFDPGVSLMAVCMVKSLVSQIYPLHSDNELKSLRTQWVSHRKFAVSQPYDAIRRYFGLKIAFYFSFLYFYTKALIPPAVFGTILYLILYRTSGTPEEIKYEILVAVALSLFNVIWSTVFLEMWKRHSSELAFEWGVLETTSEPDVINPLFKSKVAPNPITGNLELMPLTFLEKGKKYGITAAILFVALCVSVGSMLSMYALRDHIRDNYSTNTIILLIPQIFLSVLIVALSTGYRFLAKFLTTFENHRLREEFCNALIVKLVVFHFINSYLILFYIAFWRQDLDLLKTQLAALVVSRQLFRIVQETVVPYATQYVKKMHLAGKASDGGKDEDDDDDAELLSDDVKSTLSTPELESVMGTYSDTINDYMEMLIQFGYVVLFSGAFPLAGLLCFANNILELRTDAFKICFSLQRPFAHKAKSIGVWQTAFEAMGYIAVAVNFAMLVVFGRFDKWLPDLTFPQVMALLIIGEHAFFALKCIIMMVIPDVPGWVILELARAEHLQQEAILNEWRRRGLPAEGSQDEPDIKPSPP